MNNLSSILSVVWQMSGITCIPWIDFLSFDDCNVILCVVETGNFHELNIELDASNSLLNARFFRTEALWEVDHVNELGIVLNSNFNINDRCPGYKTVKGTFNITNEIFLPFKLHSGKGTVGVKAINKFNELLLCLKIPVLIIEDYVELNEEKICPEKL